MTLYRLNAKTEFILNLFSKNRSNLNLRRCPSKDIDLSQVFHARPDALAGSYTCEVCVGIATLIRHFCNSHMTALYFYKKYAPHSNFQEA